MDNDTMESMQRLAYTGKRILEAMRQNGINSLMMLAYEIFEAPILLADVNSRVIFQYPLTEIGDAAYDTLLQKKVMDSEIAERYFTDLKHDKYDLWEPMYACEGLTSAYPRLYAVVCYYGIKQATLAVFLGDKPLRDGDFDLIKMFTNALEIKFKKDIKGNLEWTPPTAACLQDILEPSASPHLKHAAARTLSENLTGAFALMVTNIGRMERQRSIAFYAVSELMSTYRNLVCVIFEDKLVTLIGEVSSKRFDPHSQRFIKNLSNKLFAYKLTSGISLPFSDISLVPAYYQQASLVAQMANKQNAEAFLYADDVFGRLIFRKFADSSIPYIFLHALIPRIQDYDRQNNTVYLQTLKAYCYAFFDKDKAAAICCTHRNTVAYRLNKMAQLFQIDLEDDKLRRELYVSFLLLDEMDDCLGEM